MSNVENPIPITYAGGARSLEDLDLVERLSGGRVDLTIGSALDIFGGGGVRFEDCVAWNRGREREGEGGGLGGGREWVGEGGRRCGATKHWK